MNLKEKLAQLERQTRRPPLHRKNEKPQALRNLPEGEELVLSEGRFYRMIRRFPLQHTHGDVLIGGLRTRSLEGARFIVRNPAVQTIHAEELLFLDTETTGLSGGVGTMAFLIGIGYFLEDSFWVEQIFARDFREERAALAYLLNRSQPFVALVSYNGKSFDWPLLVNRWILNRLPPPNHLRHHLDLLFLSRRLWRRTIGECTLGNVEKQILNVRRFGDVPGYLVPQIYFDFLRSRDATELQKVFYHNQMDVLSLAALLDFQLDILDGRLDGKTLDPVALGKLFVEMKEMEKGEEVLKNHGQHSSLETPFAQEVALFLARLYKRRGEWESALALWKQALADGRFSVEPYEELAKFYEHHQRNYTKALEYTDSALRKIDILEKLGRGGQWQGVRKALIYRRDRLHRKLQGKQ